MGDFYNELNPYCAAVLRARIAEGSLPQGIVDERDITTIPDQDFLGFDHVHLFAGIGGFPLGMALAGFPEGLRVVTGGFPCQDISNAGKRAGITGARSGLWREMARCIRVVRPDIVLVENVAALLGRGISTVLGDLAEIGYDAKWDCVSAADAGAPHLRERIWIMAYPQRAERRQATQGRHEQNGNDAGRQEAASGAAQRRENVAYPSGERCGEARPNSQRPSIRIASSGDVLADSEGRIRQRQAQRESGYSAQRSQDLRDFPIERLPNWAGGALEQPRTLTEFERPSGREIERDFRGVAHGVRNRVDRLTALGNAIVPQVCAEAIRRLLSHD